jgi:hypothetical protein
VADESARLENRDTEELRSEIPKRIEGIGPALKVLLGEIS